jgi:hypothetical protein
VQEIGHDCTNWTPAVFYDLMRLGDGTGASSLLLLLRLLFAVLLHWRCVCTVAAAASAAT